MIRLLRLFAFALLICTCSLAFADAGGAAAADPWAPFFALLAVACGSVGAIVRTYTPATGFWHGWWGHILLMLAGALLGSLGPMFQAGIVSKVTLIGALCGGLSSFLAAWKTGFKQAAGATALLPLLLLPVLLASGCHGFKAPAYATLTAMSGAAGVAAQQLPSICEGQENAAVDAAKSAAAAAAVTGAIHARCTLALTSLDGIGKGLRSARDAVHDAPAGADLSSAMPWLQTITKQYCDLVPLLADFKITLPTFPGVC